MTSVHILKFFGPYFPALGLNKGRYGVSLRIQSEMLENTGQKNSEYGHFSRSEANHIIILLFFLTFHLIEIWAKCRYFCIFFFFYLLGETDIGQRGKVIISVSFCWLVPKLNEGKKLDSLYLFLWYLHRTIALKRRS